MGRTGARRGWFAVAAGGMPRGSWGWVLKPWEPERVVLTRILEVYSRGERVSFEGIPCRPKGLEVIYSNTRITWGAQQLPGGQGQGRVSLPFSLFKENIE